MNAVELLLIDHIGNLIHLVAARHHLEQVAHWAQVTNHEHHVQEVIERHVARAHLLGGFFRLGLIQLGLRLLNECQEVTHAQDARGHALRVKDIEILELFTGGGKHDGLAGNFTDRQRRTTTGVTVQLGEDDTGEVHAVTECLGGLDGVLTNHGIDDEEDFVGVDGVTNIARLRHQGFVDAEAAGGIDDDDVVLRALGLVDAALGDVHRITMRGTHLVFERVQRGARVRSEDVDAGALTDDLQLLHGAWALEVTGHEHRGMPLGSKVLRKLTGEGGFTSTLETRKHDDGRRVLRQVEAAGFTTKDLNEFLVDNLDDLLRRVERLGHLCAGGTFLDALDEAAHDGERDIGFEQRKADLARGGIDVRFGQLALAAQA